MLKLFYALLNWFKKKPEITIKPSESKPENKPKQDVIDAILNKVEEEKKNPIQLPLPVEKPFLNFPDISHYEKCNFDLFEVNDMLTKATEGGSFVDSTLKFNMEQCKKRGIRFGVYHFYRTGVDPIIQANHFIKTVGLNNLKDFYYEPIVDYEKTNGQTEADLKKDIPDLKLFIQEIYKQTGRWPMFYTYESLLVYLELDSFFLNCRLWIARYGKEPTKLAPWKSYWAWQYSDGEISSPKYNDNFKGIGRCDANILKK